MNNLGKNCFSRDNNLSQFIEKIIAGEVFFFAGSGISYDSGMPPASKILQKTADIFLPTDEEYKTKITRIIKNIQPEVLYENLLYLTDSIECLRLWSILSPNLLNKYGQQAMPNINHFFVVEYSVRNGVPVITTNFDTLFEDAARKLGYIPKAVLPYTSCEKEIIQLFKESKIDKQTAYIFKVHGTIELENKESLDAMFTTMSKISRANFEMLDFIGFLCRNKYITFVGYSGKDVDYFPEIKKRITNKMPYWVNEFNPENDDGTYANSKAIKAIRINLYPDKVFEKDDFKKYQNFAKVYTNTPHKNVIQDDKIFDYLQEQIRNEVKWVSHKSIFFFILLSKEIGEYKFAYEKLKELHSIYEFPELPYQISVLIYLSRLSHENAKYESCKLYAKKALSLIKSSKRNKVLIPYEIIVRCLISESKRMLIAHDTSYCSQNFNIILSISAFFSLFYTAKKVNSLLERIQQQKVIEIWASHETIEHKIRQIALLQIFFIGKFNVNTNILNKISLRGAVFVFIGKWFINQWKIIREESSKRGYSQGIANSWKFQMRLTKEEKDIVEAQRIYDLTFAATGQGLLLRNQAEIHFENRKYNESKELFHELYNIGNRSGSILNAIKGLLGVAKCNEALGIIPFLEVNDQQVLRDLMEQVEGKDWQKYFRKVKDKICTIS